MFEAEITSSSPCWRLQHPKKQIQWSKQPLVFHNLPELFHKHDFVAGVGHIVHHRKPSSMNLNAFVFTAHSGTYGEQNVAPTFSSEKFVLIRNWA